MRIIRTVLLPEASAGLPRGLTITLRLIGYSAMAGIKWRRRGRRPRFAMATTVTKPEVMVATVVALIVLVQSFRC